MSQLNLYPNASTIDAVNDELVIWTNSLSAVQNINRNTFLNLASQPVGLTDSQTLTNKTLTSPTINGATLSGTLSGTYTIGGTPTFPSSVTQNTVVQTLTNKTLTSPTINSPTITNATISADTLTGYTTSNSGTIYGVGVTTGQISGSNTVLPAALATGIPTNKFSNPYKFSVYLSSNQTVSASTWTKVQLNTKTFDTGSNFDNTTNYQFTAPIAGFYHFSAYGTPSASSTNTVQVGINVGTFSGNPTYFVNSSPGNGSSLGFGLSVLVSLTAGQTVQMYTYNASTLIYATVPGTYFMGYLVSAT